MHKYNYSFAKLRTIIQETLMNKHMLAFEKLYVFNELIRRFVIKP